ncbi:hypothetical protein CCFV1_ORF077 [Cotesia congregata filamentous virus 1]|uniref:Uncharacterized protein n=1 Tax=Cotesia congregata filamentous virus 1 TaxID=3064291 RepID=A0ABC8QNB8_9VIRU|nr:hypothetical protein CCFV1_ORF077 [Cotesia congregata filamentous virus 1]
MNSKRKKLRKHVNTLLIRQRRHDYDHVHILNVFSKLFSESRSATSEEKINFLIQQTRCALQAYLLKAQTTYSNFNNEKKKIELTNTNIPVISSQLNREIEMKKKFLIELQEKHTLLVKHYAMMEVCTRRELTEMYKILDEWTLDFDKTINLYNFTKKTLADVKYESAEAEEETSIFNDDSMYLSFLKLFKKINNTDQIKVLQRLMLLTLHFYIFNTEQNRSWNLLAPIVEADPLLVTLLFWLPSTGPIKDDKIGVFL